MRQYFSFDGMDFDTHSSLEEAKKAAQDALGYEREDAFEGWSDNVDQICCGKIYYNVEKISSRPKTDEDPHVAEIDTIDEYDLVDVNKIDTKPEYITKLFTALNKHFTPPYGNNNVLMASKKSTNVLILQLWINDKAHHYEVYEGELYDAEQLISSIITLEFQNCDFVYTFSQGRVLYNCIAPHSFEFDNCKIYETLLSQYGTFCDIAVLNCNRVLSWSEKVEPDTALFCHSDKRISLIGAINTTLIRIYVV